MQRGCVVHWGVIRAAVDHAECAGLYERLVDQHVAAGYNPSPAYNRVRCAHGILVGGRGFGILSGANGTTLSNLTLWAICAMIAPGDTPTSALLNGLRDDIDEALALSFDGQEIHYHGQIVATQCAGPDLDVWVDAGAPRPGGGTLPEEEEPLMVILEAVDNDPALKGQKFLRTEVDVTAIGDPVYAEALSASGVQTRGLLRVEIDRIGAQLRGQRADWGAVGAIGDVVVNGADEDAVRRIVREEIDKTTLGT